MRDVQKRFSGASADSAALMSVKLVTLVLGMATARILSQVLSIPQYGTYSQVMLMDSTLVSLTILGMMDGTNFFYCNNTGVAERQRYLATMAALQLIIGGGCLVLLLVLSGPIAGWFQNPALRRLTFFAALLSVTQNLISMLHVLFVAVGKARKIAARNLIVAVSRLILFGLACGMLHSVGAVLAITLTMNVLEILYLRRGLDRSGCRIRLQDADFRLVRRIADYCIPMAAFVILSSITRDCDRYVVSAFTDTGTLAVYTNASKMLPFDLITVSFGTVLVPYLTRYLSEERIREARELYSVFLKLCLTVTVILASSALAGAPMLMRLLYSEKYLSGLPVFVVYILVDILRTTNITMILSATGQGRQLMVISLVSLGANLVLNVLLCMKLGILGPAVATLIVTAVTGFVIQKKCAGILRCRLSELIGGKDCWVLAGEVLCCMAVFLRLSRMMEHRAVPYLLRLAAVSGSMALVLGLLNRKTIMACIRTIGRSDFSALQKQAGQRKPPEKPEL